MDSMRLARPEGTAPVPRCSRCPANNPRWDRLNGKALCPNCQEELARGEGAPLTLRIAKRSCAVCKHKGTVCLLTYPLEAPAPVEMALCAEHLRALLGRCLVPTSFHQLRRQLQALGLRVDDVFLLHGAFYDSQGNAILPIQDTSPGHRRAG